MSPGPQRPISVYGRSKLEAEQAALDYPRGIVVRPSTLFGSGRVNFCDYIVSQLRAGKAVEAFEDQVTSPTTPGTVLFAGMSPTRRSSKRRLKESMRLFISRRRHT